MIELNNRLNTMIFLVPLLKFFRQIEITIPTYYIMGDQDYMFLPSVKELVKVHKKSLLFVISFDKRPGFAKLKSC